MRTRQSAEPGAGQRAMTDARRFLLVPFDKIRPGAERNYLVKGLIPRSGLVVVWGAFKSGKIFWVLDLALHVVLGWTYRGKRVSQGAVVYCVFEGADGFKGRVEAFRQTYLAEAAGPVPFYLMAASLDLVADHHQLIEDVVAQLSGSNPGMVVLDTLNRSLSGSESRDEDMAAYIRAADAIRTAFDCVVVVVHHCGIEGSRPRGHSSLSAAADAQIAVKRDRTGIISAELEWMKDGPDGEPILSRLAVVELGEDVDGEPITSCAVEPADGAVSDAAGASRPRLSANQQTALSLLDEAGPDGLTTEEWNQKLRDQGIGKKRPATCYDVRAQLKERDSCTRVMAVGASADDATGALRTVRGS